MPGMLERMWGESEEEKRLKEMEAKYGAVLLRGLGLDVFKDILASFCHFGQTLDPENIAQVAEYNVGMAIISRCGDFQEVLRALSSAMPMMGIGEKPK